MNKILKFFKRRILCVNGNSNREMVKGSQFSPRITRSTAKKLQLKSKSEDGCQQEKADGDKKRNTTRTCSGSRKEKKQNKRSFGELNSLRASKGSVGSASLLHTPKRTETLSENLNFHSTKNLHSPSKILGKSPKVGTLSVDTPERTAHFHKDLENAADCKLRILGRGSFGTIIQATYKGDLVSAKVVPIQRAYTLKNELNNFLLTHPNIVKTLRIISNEDTYSCGLVIMELFSSSTLEHLANDESYDLNEKLVIRYMMDISQALSYCHSQKVLHLDVKPQNILVNVATKMCKLCDFGSSCLFQEESPTLDLKDFKTQQGNVLYTSPELLAKEPPTDKSDVYSLGITLWQLVHREKPYVADNKIDLQSTIYKIVKQKKRPQKKNKKNEELEKLYVSCWDHKPEKRPTMKEVVQYLENISLQV